MREMYWRRYRGEDNRARYNAAPIDGDARTSRNESGTQEADEEQSRGDQERIQHIESCGCSRMAWGSGYERETATEIGSGR